MPPGGLFAAAWRNYIKSVFKKGFMYTIEIAETLTLVYVAANKTLAGQEARVREDEASGRPLVVVFFRRNARGFAEQVDETLTTLKMVDRSPAELLQILGVLLPADPDRTAQTTELLLEARYQDLEVNRFPCKVAPEEGTYVYSLGDRKHAEVAFAEETETLQGRTKMVLARLLQREGKFADGEFLKSVWELPAHTLQTRSEGLLPALPAPAAAAAPAKGRGRGGRGGGGGRDGGARGRGRGGRAGGRGRG